MTPNIPKHFMMPFVFDPNTDHASEVVQGTLDDVIGCVEVAFLVEPGYRVEVPNFGVPEQIFELQPLDLDTMINAALTYEPRAGLVMEQTIDPLDRTGLTDRIEAVTALRQDIG